MQMVKGRLDVILNKVEQLHMLATDLFDLLCMYVLFGRPYIATNIHFTNEVFCNLYPGKLSIDYRSFLVN